VLVSQRTAVVAKSALSQCENLIVFKSVDQTGLDYLDAVGGSALRTLVPKLSQGEAVVCGPAISSDRPVAIRIEP
jgi:DNA helicase HerA-like ATPase